MPNSSKTLIAALLCMASFTASAETELVSQREFNETLDLAKAAYLEKNYSGAVEYYTQAAKWGDKHSQFVLGNLYAKGLGTRQDDVSAYAWMATAAENRDQAFRRAARSALKELDDAQKTRAKALAETLKSHYGMDATGVKCRKDGPTGTNIKPIVCKHSRVAANGDLIVPVYSAEAIAATHPAGRDSDS